MRRWSAMILLDPFLECSLFPLCFSGKRCCYCLGSRWGVRSKKQREGGGKFPNLATEYLLHDFLSTVLEIARVEKKLSSLFWMVITTSFLFPHVRNAKSAEEERLDFPPPMSDLVVHFIEIYRFASIHSNFQNPSYVQDTVYNKPCAQDAPDAIMAAWKYTDF